MKKWKTVKGYENYEVSDTGEVRRIGGEVMRQWVTNWGYRMVQLWRDGVGKHHSVHRLVANAFIDNPDNLPQVNHIDENKANNSVDNLEWCSAKHNINHGERNAKTSKALTNNPLRSRRVLQYSKDGAFIMEYPSLHEAERCTGVQAGSICYSAKGTNRIGGGYVWKYAQEGKR